MPLRVLVVDDNVDAAHMVRILCEMDGHDVRVANSGDEALATLAGFTPEVGVFDIGMPGMSGLELATRVLEQLPDVRLIALSGWAQEQDMKRSAAVGFVKHLRKPVALDELRAAVNGLESTAGA